MREVAHNEGGEAVVDYRAGAEAVQGHFVRRAIGFLKVLSGKAMLYSGLGGLTPTLVGDELQALVAVGKAEMDTGLPHKGQVQRLTKIIVEPVEPKE